MAQRNERTRQLIEQMTEILRRQPGLDKHRIAAELAQSGAGVDTKAINPVLYGSPRFVADKSETLPKWSLAATRADYRTPTASSARVPQTRNRFLKQLTRAPRPWQIEALAAWNAASRCGVIEAVTGTGKTFLGVLAAREQLERGGKVVVLVPGKTLAGQWKKALAEIVEASRIGLLGDGKTDGLTSHDVLIATVQSGWRRELLPKGTDGLLVADECHNYGADKFRLALESGFANRLGLTATFERSDDGVASVLEPFFHGVVYRIGYKRAIQDGVVAHFRVALIGVSFTFEERMEYDVLGKTLKKRADSLIRSYRFPDVWNEPSRWGVFLQMAGRLAKSGESGSVVARSFLIAFARRRKLLAETSAKLDSVSDLSDAARAASRAIVFTQTKTAAVEAVTVLNQYGVPARSLYAGFEDDQRDTVLAEFGDGTVQVLVAPRLLDEGVDVPEADLAIVMAAGRSRRQMIQRMGRVLRPKVDGRAARFAVLYVVGTTEDPGLGAHQSFLEEALENADDSQTFSGAKAAVAFLQPDWR